MSTQMHCLRCRRHITFHQQPQRGEPCPTCGEKLRRGAGRRTRPAIAWDDEPLSDAETLRRHLDGRRA